MNTGTYLVLARLLFNEVPVRQLNGNFKVYSSVVRICRWGTV